MEVAEKISDINQLDMNGLYTYADYLTWTFKERVELIKGKIFRMSPAPSTIHQIVALNLAVELRVFLKKKKCKAFVAPFDVRLAKNKSSSSIKTVVQPDVCVVCDHSKLDKRGCLGAPDLVVEILSPANNEVELSYKFDLYESNGVKEYWIVYPFEQ